MMPTECCTGDCNQGRECVARAPAVTTPIEWFRPGQQLPDDETLVIMAIGGETDTGYLAGSVWIRDMSMPVESPAPDWWAHFPAAPEVQHA